ncbi:MAG: YeeE/YedE family protein [Kofleriaceae bacterium]
MSSWMFALVGGVMIGGAAALLLLTHGRVAGISGILGGLLSPATTDRAWRYAFLGGLLVAGLGAGVFSPSMAGGASWPLAIIGGLLVGYGARLGSGCTSGHGVCGLARTSPRSLVAVATFMTTGAIAATLRGVFV